MRQHQDNPAHKIVLDGLLLGMPGVKSGKAFGHNAYKVNGRIFAILSANVSIKLPAERVQELLASHPETKPFTVGDGVVWKEWLSIQRPNSDDYAQDIALFEESLQYVASG